MTCNIDIDSKGKIKVQGENAKIFHEALLRYDNDVDALDIYAVSLTDEFKQTNLPVTLRNVLNFIESDNIRASDFFTPQELQDIYDTNYSDFVEAVTNKNGEFSLSYTRLRKFYSPQEADELLASPELQEKVHKLWYKFKNSEEALEEYEFDLPPVKITTDEKTVLGTYRRQNPDKLNSELGELATQAENIQEFQSEIYDSENESLIDVQATQELFDFYTGKQALTQYTENPVTQELELKTFDSPLQQLLHTFDTNKNTQNIEDEIVSFIEVSNSVLEANPDLMQEMLYVLEEELTDIGIDVVGLSELGWDVNTYKEYLASVYEFLYQPEQGYEAFAEHHNRLFETETNNRKVIKK